MKSKLLKASKFLLAIARLCCAAVFACVITHLHAAISVGLAAPAARLQISRNGFNLSLAWPGADTLQTSAAVTGPWSSVPGASSPFATPPASAQGFFRTISPNGQSCSANVVGYVNLTLRSTPSGTVSNLVANPFNTGSNNLDVILPLPAAYDGTVIYRFDPATQNNSDAITFTAGVGWFGNDPSLLVIHPGEGFWIFPVGPDPLHVTFVGEVPQGLLVNPLPAANRFAIKASMVPQAAAIGDELTPGTLLFPAEDLDTIFLPDPVSGGFGDAYTYFDGVGWFSANPDDPGPQGPIIPPGAGFVLQKASTAIRTSWVRAFNASDCGGGPVRPVITMQPQDRTVARGDSAAFSVTASNGPLTYQWRFYGTNNIAGATNPSYAVFPALEADAGLYDVVVQNAGGSITSAPARLVVLPHTDIEAVNLTLTLVGSNLFDVTPVLNLDSGAAQVPLDWALYLNGSLAVKDTNHVARIVPCPVPCTSNDSCQVTIISMGMTNPPMNGVCRQVTNDWTCKVPLTLWPHHNVSIPPGITNLLLVLDPDNRVNEFNESNNVFAVAAGMPRADVALAVEVNPAAALVGDFVQIGLTVTNLGPNEASNIFVAAPLAFGLTLLAAGEPPGTIYDVGTGQWSIPSLAAGAGLTLSLLAEATGVGTFVNTAARLASSPADTNSTNDFAAAVVTVTPRQADLVLVKTASAAWVSVDEPFFFYLVVTNLGPETATGVAVSDVLPPGLAPLFVDSSQGVCSNSGNLVSCQLGSLAAGSSAHLVIEVAALSEQTFFNTASVTANELDLNTTNNFSAAAVLALVPPFVITQPQAQTVPEGSRVIFNVSAGGSAPLAYQWRFNEADLPGQTGASLTLSNVNAAYIGSYAVTVSNHAGVVLSEAAVLDVQFRYTVAGTAGPNGAITPAGGNTYAGGANATFTAAAALNYIVDQWFLDGVPAQNGGGAYTLSNIETNHAVHVTFRTLDPCQGFAVNFAAGTDTLAPGDIAGVLPQDGWANAVGPTGTLTLQNGVTVQWMAGTTITLAGPAYSPDFTLMQGALDTLGGTTLVTVSGLTFGSTYDVYVHCAGENSGAGQTRVGRYTLNGTVTRFALDAPAAPDFDGNYVEAASTNGGPGAASGNYVVFRDVSGASFTLAAQGDFSSNGALRAPINAVQLIPRTFVTPVPLRLGIGRLPSGQLRLNVNGPPGSPVALESSTNLMEWTSFTSLVNAGGFADFNDTNAPSAAQMFYRAMHAGFPSGADNMVFLGSAPGVSNSSASLTLRGNVGQPQFAWTSQDPVLGAINTGFIDAADWVVIPGFGECPARIIFRAIQGCTNFSGSIIFGNGTVTIDVRCIINDIARQARYILACPVDLDIDSDCAINPPKNNFLGPPDRSAAEEAIEDDPGKSGKVVCVNNGDTDNAGAGDGVPDLVDGFNADNKANTADDTPPPVNFVQVVLELPPPINPALATVSFTYGGSDPGGVVAQCNAATGLCTNWTIPAGHVRLWMKDGNVFRDKRALPVAGGDFIPAGVAIPAMRLGFTAAMRAKTFYLEGIAPGAAPGDQRIKADVDPGDALIAAFCSDAVRATVVRANLSIPNVREHEKVTRGAVLCLNNDNDDFAAPNYDADNTQNNVPGEDDLQPLTLAMDFSGLAVGQVRLDIAAGQALKIWFSSTKANRLLLSAAGTRGASATPATFARFRGPLYVEGFARSTAVKDSELKLTYRLTPDDAQPLCEQRLKLTVVELLLDADLNNALTDDAPRFEPGYGFPGTPQAGDPVITVANPEQLLQIIAAPISVDIVDAARFTLAAVGNGADDTTTYPGLCMNQGSSVGPDYSLQRMAHVLQRDVMAFGGMRAVSDLVCRDYGGRTVARVALLRNNDAVATLAACPLRLPLDTDRDLLPDFYETAHRTDPLRGNMQVFDVRDPNTRFVQGNLAAAAGPPAVPLVPGFAAMPSAMWDHETQNPVCTGNPIQGYYGDGFIALEEYRGFFRREGGGARHRRLSPLRKDLFARNGIGGGGEASDGSISIGYLPNAPLDVHNAAANHWNNDATRVVNFNSVPGATPQKGLILQLNPALGGPQGLTYSGGVNTGPDGICQTDRRPDDMFAPGFVARNRGLPNSVCIAAGPNGIIDPPFDRARDVLDPANHRINEGTDGKLDTVVVGYAPQGDDRVRGAIHGGDAGKLHRDTLANRAGDDVLRGAITGTDASPLDPATVGAAPNDELVNVVLVFANANDPVNAADTRNPDGTVSPRNPGNTMDDGFQTARGANDYFRGTIGEGGNNRLDATPAGMDRDRVVGRIEEGADNNLQSRPRGMDFVRGFIDGGPNGKLNPRLNNFAGNVTGSVPATPCANDDMFDPANDSIHTGADGACNTRAEGDDDQVIPSGNGQPYTSCIVSGANDTANSPANTTAAGAATGGDDVQEQILNSSAIGTPNETGVCDIDAAAHIGVFRGPDGVFNTPDDVNFSGVPAPIGGGVVLPALPAARRVDSIRRTAAHELGHGMHLFHYGAPEAPTRMVDGDGRAMAGGARAHAAAASVMFSPQRNPAPNNYDQIDSEQIRLHLKH